jgi:hypothetical protein
MKRRLGPLNVRSWCGLGAGTHILHQHGIDAQTESAPERDHMGGERETENKS